MKTLLRWVDRLAYWTGASARWLCITAMLVGVFEVTMRYVFDSPTTWTFELIMMLGGASYAIGWGYAHYHDSHVRMDVFYSRLSSRGKAISDLVFSAIFFFPLMFFMARESVIWAMRSWRINEVMVQTYWYPPAGPYRTVLAIGLCLFLVHGAARFARDLYLVVRRQPID